MQVRYVVNMGGVRHVLEAFAQYRRDLKILLNVSLYGSL